MVRDHLSTVSCRRAAGTSPLQPASVQLKSNIDDAARLVDGFITGLVLAATTRSRSERDLSANARRLFCNSDVANNVVIAACKTDGCNQMSVIAPHAYCRHLISAVSFADGRQRSELL